jgi:hypothetical protein
MLLGHGQQGLCLHRLPRRIHQTVANKSRLSCEEKRVIASWKKLNPDYTHYLWDDQDMRKFMLQVSDSSASSCMHLLTVIGTYLPRLGRVHALLDSSSINPWWRPCAVQGSTG